MTPAIYPTKCARCDAPFPVADGRLLCDVDRMADALQGANLSYVGDEGNLFAYWRHLAAAAIRANRLREEGTG